MSVLQRKLRRVTFPQSSFSLHSQTTSLEEFETKLTPKCSRLFGGASRRHETEQPSATTPVTHGRSLQNTVKHGDEVKLLHESEDIKVDHKR